VKLVIELDGDSHAQQTDYDTERTRWLQEQKGYRVIRFTNEDVHRNVEAVVELTMPHRTPPDTAGIVKGHE
jgi:very-short-patch-repair endonuclease